MAAPFATVDDLRAHWRELPVEREPDAAQKLKEASIEIRGLYPDIDARIANGRPDVEVVVLVTCRMVRRAMDVAEGLENIANISNQAGPFGQTTTFKNTDGKLYLTLSDKRLLSPQRGGGKAFSTMPS